MTSTEKVWMSLPMTLEFTEEDGKQLVRCQEFDVATFGDNYLDARDMIHDAIIVYLEALDDIATKA